MTDPAPEYAFEGEIEAPLALTLLGKRQVRRAFIAYHYTPHWPFWDPATGVLTGLPTKIAYQLRIRIPRGQASAAGLGNKPVHLETLDLLAVLTAQPGMRDLIEHMIEVDVRRRDGIARRENDVAGSMPDDWL
jgi:hypothetical protein